MVSRTLLYWYDGSIERFGPVVMTKYHTLVGILLVSFFANIVLAFFFARERSQNTMQSLEEAVVAYPFLSKRIFTVNQNDLLVHFVPLRRSVQDYVAGKNGDLGVYFEYLPTGTSIGVNDAQRFILASLLKVPMAMAVYQQVERGALDLDEVYTIQNNDLDPNFGSLWRRGVGAKITLRQAIELTLTESDNTAKNILMRALPAGALEDIFDSLDIPKELDGEDAVVTPKNYTSILRSLYLSSLLTKEHSNEILEILTRTPFNDKLAAPIPDDIPVAHKIGVILNYQNLQRSTYTDCGIVYYPQRPYALCVMVHGSEETARKWMSEVSKMVYEFVAKSNT